MNYFPFISVVALIALMRRLNGINFPEGSVAKKRSLYLGGTFGHLGGKTLVKRGRSWEG